MTDLTNLTHNINYSSHTGYIMFDISKPAGLPQKFVYDETEFLARDELHISLLDCRKTAGELQIEEAELVDTFSDIVRTACLGVVTLQTPLYECRKASEPVRTIVAKAEVIGLSTIFDILQYRRGRTVPRPFPHVTLYTSDGGRGIAVRDSNAFRERCHDIEAPELEAILAAH